MSFYSIYAEMPPSEPEWEDLLVRYEIAPRALRVALADGDAEGPARERIGDLLRAAVMLELWTAELLRAMRDGTPPDPGARMRIAGDDRAALVSKFADLRARNFAAVQRRGLEVWRWRTEAPGQGPVTAYQLIQSAVAQDGETLAAVRQALRGAAAC
jgi:hypothetical protein